MLLLGVTAISLLTTPMVISLCNTLLNDPRHHLSDYILLGGGTYSEKRVNANDAVAVHVEGGGGGGAGGAGSGAGGMDAGECRAGQEGQGAIRWSDAAANP